MENSLLQNFFFISCSHPHRIYFSTLNMCVFNSYSTSVHISTHISTLNVTTTNDFSWFHFISTFTYTIFTKHHDSIWNIDQFIVVHVQLNLITSIRMSFASIVLTHHQFQYWTFNFTYSIHMETLPNIIFT